MKNNWQSKKLIDLCDFFTDGNWIESKDQSPNGIRLIQTGNIGNGIYKDRSGKSRYISEKTFTKLKCTEIFSGDILVSRLPDPVGRSCILPEIGERMITAVDCSILRLSKEILPIFFNYYTQTNTYLNDIEQLTSGTTRQRISRKNLGLIKIPLPPLQEQKRIVKILDEVFEDIKKAKINAEKNLNNSKELFESYLQSVFGNSKHQYKPLGDVCAVIGGGTPSKSGSSFEKFYNGDIPWATVRDMRSDVIVETQYKISKEAVKNSSTNIIPKNNVVIATRVGLGKICFIKNDTAINQDLRGIIPLSHKNLSVNYLFWWFKSISDIIVKNGTGATVHGVKLPFIKSLQIPLPSLVEQNNIVKKLTSLSAETKIMEFIYQKKLSDLEELKKSILKKAFNGEL